jgi:hypothetical protein
MAMSPYPIRCYTPGCDRLAVYKIAARWTDGLTHELKTYSLCCAECLPQAFSRGRAKQAACRLAPGEVLESPGIYRMERGQRDQKLHRLPDVEQQLAQG